MQYVLVYQSVVCLKLTFGSTTHRPTNRRHFLNLAKSLLSLFPDFSSHIWSLLSLSRRLRFAFFKVFLVYLSVCLWSCLSVFSFCLFSVCLSRTLCLFICFSAWLSAFCQLASVHQSTSVDNRFNSTYIGRSMRCKRLNLVLYILHMQPFIPRDPFSPDKPCLFSPWEILRN